MKKKEKEYYKDEVAKLRRQLEGTEVFATSRRRSSTHQHSVPPPSSRRQSTGITLFISYDGQPRHCIPGIKALFMPTHDHIITEDPSFKHEIFILNCFAK